MFDVRGLEALGARRLAELLLDIATGDAAIKRRLRLEVASSRDPTSVQQIVAKRLSAIARSRVFVPWDKTGPVAADITAQHRAIVERVAKDDPTAALALLWRLIALADGIFGRSDDSNGRIGEAFRDAARDLGPLALAAKADPLALAERVFAALQDNGYGQFDHLIASVAPALGAQGLERLKRAYRDWDGHGVGANTESTANPDQHRARIVRSGLEDIADALGDVDGYIAQQDARSQRAPVVAAEIGRRLLAANRPDEALRAIDRAAHNGGYVRSEWQRVRIDVLRALGRTADVQTFRYECFTRTLDADHLRAYLADVPGDDAIDAHERAMEHAARFPEVHAALALFIQWPELERAGRLIIERAAQLNGDAYDVLLPAADALAGSAPLAATIALRTMIDFTLARARSTRYRYAARHLAQCARLAPAIADYGAFVDHDAYLRALRAAHGRKASFWSMCL